jgi:hypothetical protein
MIFEDDERKRRVRRVLAAATRVADPGDPIGRQARALLPVETGLSPEGVDLGLSRHLETAVADDDLALLVARAGAAPHVHVVLSANVFVGAVRALAIAVATAPRVSVRSSRRESVMVPLLLRALPQGEGACTGVGVVSAVEPRPGDELHVYGRRESIEAVVFGVPAGVRVRAHGPGIGIAILDVDDPADGWTDAEAARAAGLLSWDVVPFDQRGCLSPRIVLFRGSTGLGEAFCAALAAELSSRNVEIPRGRLDQDESASATLYRETIKMVGTCIEGSSFAVGFDPRPAQLLLPPPGRHVHVACVNDPGDVAVLLDPLRTAVTTIGALGRGPAVRAAAALAPRARMPRLGEMQRPPLDGPVDLRDVE